MMNIHDSDLIPTTKEDKAIAEGLSGSSGEVSSFSMCPSEDASSSSSSNGAFDDLSNLISQLPIIHVKNGLSKFYKGKSQSFKSLANVTSLKDLVKKESRMKSCRSSRGIFKQRRKRAYSTNATISMKGTKTS